MLIKLNAFFSADNLTSAGGNRCELVAHKPDDRKLSSGAITRCFSWPLSINSQNTFYVECEQHGNSISCCGHGLLSAGYYWLKQTQSAKITLLMNGSAVSACKDGERIWLTFPQVFVTPVNQPVWLTDFFSSLRGIRCASAGGESAYLIIQWPDNTDLSSFTCPDFHLAQYTARALICTARQTRQDEDIHYRYFAPQYSTQEDNATGSAMRVLVSYYQQEHLSALQISKRKGLLFGRLNSDSVSVGGYCSEYHREYGIEQDTST